MKGIICLINFQHKADLQYDNDNKLYNSLKTGLWVDKDYKGKYTWTVTDEKRFILIIGTAFFKEQVDQNQQLINNEAHLKVVQKELDRGNSPKDFLTGFYNLISVDEVGDKAIVHNSHFGMRQLFYSKKDKQLIIATNPELIIQTGFVKGEIYLGSVLQFVLLNYTLNEDSIFKNVYTLPSGSRISFSATGFNLERYFDAGSLITRPEFNHKESIQLVHNAFNNVIKKYANNISTFSLSLTGGWDGRLILSMLKDKNVEVSTYSHGTANNPDIIIPQAISKQLGINYTSYLLDELYYKNHFCNLAIATLDNSSCMRSVSRSHYLYSVGSEMVKNDYVLTGICGSNLMKGNIIPGPVSNSLVLKFIYERNFNLFWAQFLGSYFRNIIKYIKVPENILEELKVSLSKLHKHYHITEQRESRLYGFLLNSIERKYFGNEIMTYSHLGENLSPFIDIDFIKALTRSTFFGAYITTNSKNIFANWKSSLLYAEMINRSYPDLGKFKSDKGICLDDLQKIYKWPWIAVKQVQKKMRKSNTSYFDHSLGVRSIIKSLEHNNLIKADQISLNNGMISETLYNIISYYYWILSRHKIF